MRSVPRGSYARISDPVRLWHAYLACRRNKRRTPSQARFELDADFAVVALSRALREGTYRPSSYRIHVIFDPKKRLIAAPVIRDRILHRALLDDIGPTYARGFSPRSFAWGTGRGPHRAVLAALRLMRRYRFRMHLDVRRYFMEIHRPTLYRLFARRLRDADTLGLIERLVEKGGAIYRRAEAIAALGLDDEPLPPDSGLAIGSYLSQWSGAFYLDGLDQHVARTLKHPGYLRYMDDLLFFADDGETLERLRRAVADWLGTERRLRLKATGGEIVPTERSGVYLGYRISRGWIDASRKLRRRMIARLRVAAAKGPEALARTEASYRGLLLFG